MQQLSDLPSPALHETIVDFHNVRKRFDAFVRALEKDRINRAKHIPRQKSIFLKHEPIIRKLEKALASGRLPVRTTHNDTKFNNVLLDAHTQKQCCVVDLDTVMPGTLLYDFGDMVRTTTSPTMEDERDLSKVRMRMPMFKALAQGYLEATTNMMTRRKVDRLFRQTHDLHHRTALSHGLSPGRHLLQVHRPLHNLDRSRTRSNWLNRSNDRKKRCRLTSNLLVEVLWSPC